MQGGITDWMAAGYLETIDAEWLYLEHCAYCHFVEGDCEGVAPTPFGPFPEKIEEKIRSGVIGVMPSFQGILNEEEIDALVKHLTIGEVNSELEIPIEILTAGPIAVLYWDKCSGCHGDNRQGGVGPALIPQRLNEIDNEILTEIIRYGQPGTSMPAWQDILTQQEIGDLIEYILSPVID
jgi:mono/diheme cytochrome c family protein